MNKKLLEKVTITMPASLKDVVIKLNNSGLKIICVVDKNDKLIGTISDGDIRRSLLKNTSLNQSIEKVVNKNPILINEERDFLKVDKIFNKYKISAIPVVDKKNVLKDLITSFDSESLNNIIYIIAGGRGKRMMPLTRENPKPLLNYMGEPILKKIIKKISNEGFDKIVISINYLGHKIENYFKNGKDFGVNINYIKEKKELGTAGSLYDFYKNKNNLPIIITNADLATNLKFRDILNFHNHNHADITMAIKKHEYQNPFGVINSDGIVLKKIVEKPVLNFNINAGVYVINKNVLKDIKKNEYLDIPDLINFNLSKNKKIIIFPLHEDWKDLQNPKDLI